MAIDYIDIKTDERFTYSMRIELGKIFADQEKSDLDKFKETYECLYNHTPKASEYKELILHFEQIVNDLVYWLETEEKMLASTPSADEIAAGVREYSQAVGELATVISLSKDYHTFPNDILKRPYAEIFGILYADSERAKFERRLNDVIMKKNKWHK